MILFRIASGGRGIMLFDFRGYLEVLFLFRCWRFRAGFSFSRPP